MKSKLVVVAAATSLAWTFTPQILRAQAGAVPFIAERGPHHRVMSRVMEELRSDGKRVPRISSVTELETGMHYWEDNQWKETSETIEIINGVAVARRGPHKVIFDANLHAPGAIDLETPDGKRFRSHILGLAYLDATSGKSVMIAEVKDCVGAVLPPNQVWYQDAFDGDCVADVRFTYTKGGFEQDVVFRVAPPSPSAYGLPAATTHLAVFTEFPEAPAPDVRSVVLKEETDPVRRQQMAEPDVIDQALDFGVMKIGSGQAFPLGDSDIFGGSSAPTFKSWELIDGRLFLLERVEYSAVVSHLQRLPQTAAANPQRSVIERAPGKKLWARLFPGAPNGGHTKWKENQFAQVDTKRPGFVLDYQTLNGSLTNYCFKGDTTYVIRGNVSLYQTTIIEGGAVVKFTNSVGPRIELNGPVDCRTDRYRPAVFTAKDDNTVGEIAPGSTGTPSGTYAFYTLLAKDSTTTYDFHDIRIRYAAYGFPLSGKKMNLSHVQVGNVTRAVAFSANPEINYRNFLFFNADFAFAATSGATNRAEHGTFHRIGTFISDTNVSTNTWLTNCLLISVTNKVVFAAAANVQTNLSDTGVFQSVGAASYYLATNSVYRDAGTTNLNAGLSKDLKFLTTYPPIVLSNQVYTNDLNLQPQAQRDTDTPDLGYHYPPLDYVAGGVFVTNATISASGGVAIGTFAPNGSATYGLSPSVASQLASEGSPTNLNRIVRYNVVQEQSNSNWTNAQLASIHTTWVGGGPAPATVWRFTEWSTLAQDVKHLDGDYADDGSHSFLHCQFHGGKLATAHPTLNLTNCLLNRVVVSMNDDFGTWNVSPVFRNVLFYGGTLDLDHQSTDAWTFKDNLFDNTWVTNQAGTYTNDYNGYTTNVFRLPPNGTHDVLLASSNVNYEVGSLGSFYLPTNSAFIDRGSTWATNVGLYHFTTTTNQVKEGATTNDISFHYVAVTNGVPIDTDGDGWGDYLEDANGNGSLDSGETNPNDASDWGLRIFITRPGIKGNLP